MKKQNTIFQQHSPTLKLNSVKMKLWSWSMRTIPLKIQYKNRLALQDLWKLEAKRNQLSQESKSISKILVVARPCHLQRLKLARVRTQTEPLPLQQSVADLRINWPSVSFREKLFQVGHLDPQEDKEEWVYSELEQCVGLRWLKIASNALIWMEIW